MDPPYRDSFTQYGQTFDDQAHVNLIDFCKQADLAGNFVYYCNRDAGDNFYLQHKAQLDIEYYNVTYTAGRRKQTKTDIGVSHSAKSAQEILLYSPAITAMNCKIVQQPKKQTSPKKSKSIADQLFE
jgi:DNA adenine methylase